MKAAVFLAATGFAGWLAAVPAYLQAQTTATVTNTQLQSNFNGATGAGQTAPIAAQAFTFSGASAFINITSVSITFTVIDGDTGLGPNGVDETPYPPPGDGTQYGDDDFDVNSWTLQLNGINLGQGLLLNGFNAYDNSRPVQSSDFVTVTITGVPANVNALLAALKTGSLTATVYDSTGVANSNGFLIPNTLIDHTTPLNATLSITGTVVPEPSAWSALLLCAAVIGVALRSRLRLAHRR